ncbi:MAG: response regulator [Bacteroidota bacterium]|nr:response regulator [Bacteroidota bacterium]
MSETPISSNNKNESEKFADETLRQFSDTDYYNESNRLRALKSYDVLDTKSEESFDALTKIAKMICGTSISLVSLLDENRQWFKSKIGIEVEETHKDLSFCKYAIGTSEIFEIKDASKDDRFKDNPLVTGDPNIRFYAGAPLVSPEGYVLGTLCVIDSEPNQLTEEQRDILMKLSKQAVALLELRKANSEMNSAWHAAEQSQLAKEEFFANMSHEIRTPMNGVIGMISLLLNTELSAEQKDYVETIRISGESLLTVINDILDFSKIESGKLELEPATYELRSVIEETFDLLAVQAASKNLELLYYLETDTPDLIHTDITRLRQILVNLVSNAIKFTDRGEILVKVSATKQNSKNPYILEFSVKDTGIGIKSEKLVKLFKTFSQVDSSITRKFGGTGLGLAIVSRLSGLLGGYSWAESEYGKGSTFHFTISSPSVQVNDNDNPAIRLSRLAGKRLLLIDDNETNLKILQKQTEIWNLNSKLAKSAAEGLGLLQLHKFDAVVIDMLMPEMDGLELAQHIKENTIFNDIPLILFSSVGFFPKSKKHLRKYFHTVLEKPLKFTQLRQTLINVLDDATSSNDTSTVIHYSNQIDIDKVFIAPAVLPVCILVAEDNMVNQKLIKNILSKLGYDCDTVANGQEAVDAVKRKEYHIIFMDIQMPEVSGLEATKIINDRLEEKLRPFIIAVTANANESDKDMCMGAGMDDYISKPYKLEGLRDKLDFWANAAVKKFELV